MRNLEDRDPTEADVNYMRDLRRANLDAMSGKARSTISGHVRGTKKMVANALRNNKTPTVERRGPFPLGDPVGMGLAVDILQESLVAVGRNEATVQAETLRKLRSTYTKLYESGPRGVAEVASFGRGTGRVKPTSCPSQSEWFQDFWRGLENRMGHKSKANHPLPMGAMVRCIELIKEAAQATLAPTEANHLYKVGAYLTFCTAGALRGNEGFFLDLAAVRTFQDVGWGGHIPNRLTSNTILTEEDCLNLPHVVLPLLGNFKGETGIDHHLINLASNSMSSLEPRWWLDKLVEISEQEGRLIGPAFGTTNGTSMGDVANPLDYDATFREFLHKVQDESNAISDDRKKLLSEKYDVDAMFGISRTPRKTTINRLKRAGLGEKADEMGRWSKTERAGNKRVRHKMHALYSDAVLLMPVTWRVSYAL